MINKKEYTLLLLRNVENLFTEVRKFVEENSDILELTKDESLELKIEDKSKFSDFKFSISNPNQDNNNKILYEIEYNPYNSVSLTPKKVSTIPDSILKILEQWTNLIRSYNDVNLTPGESILNEYQKEFENFELLDEDADTHPYELDKQIIIHNYFVHVINILEENKKENKELIKEAVEIKDNIPKMTKRTTVKKA